MPGTALNHLRAHHVEAVNGLSGADSGCRLATELLPTGVRLEAREREDVMYIVRTPPAVIAVAALLILTCLPASAQRGVGDPFGIASRVEKPDIHVFGGTITSVEVGPCEASTGRSLTGLHLMVRSEGGHNINLHVGPANDVRPLVGNLEAGTLISFEAFRTEELPENALVARAISHAGGTVVLRDETLRPVWAGARARPHMGRGHRY
ncbi:MAG: hypothetical protein ACOCTG_06950 [Bacteroidota bacterium]